MWPFAIAGGQALLGLYQNIRANSIKNKAQDAFDANPYRIPESATRSVALAGKMAQGSRLPNQELIEENLASNTAGAINNARQSATSPSQVLAATVQSYANQQKAQEELDLRAANSFQQRQMNYAQALQSLAPYETKKWEYSTLFPYQAKLNQAEMMGGAGMQNIGQGLQSGLTMYANDQYMKTLSSTGKTVAPPVTQPITFPTPNYWNGGAPDNSIAQRQGTYF